MSTRAASRMARAQQAPTLPLVATLSAGSPPSTGNRIFDAFLARMKDLGQNFTLTAAQAKLKTGRLAVKCSEEAVQIHGGYGYIEEYPVCRMYRDAKILTIGEGTDEVQQMVIARALGA